MAAMVLLTVVVAFYMVYVRISAVRDGSIKQDYFKTFDASHQPPARVAQASRHFANLFELPVLFYAGCLACMVLALDSAGLRGIAWLFVISRTLHAYEHLGANRVLPRMAFFVSGFVCVVILWIWITLAAAHVTY